MGIQGNCEVIEEDAVHEVREDDDARVLAKAPGPMEFEVLAQTLTEERPEGVVYARIAGSFEAQECRAGGDQRTIP